MLRAVLATVAFTLAVRLSVHLPFGSSEDPTTYHDSLLRFGTWVALAVKGDEKVYHCGGGGSCRRSSPGYGRGG